MKKKLIYRLLLSPIIFLYAIIILIVGTFFPIPIIIGISILGLIAEPFIWLLNKGGSKVYNIEPLFDRFDNNAIGHLLGITIYIWSPFVVVYNYIRDGRLIFIHEDFDEF